MLNLARKDLWILLVVLFGFAEKSGFSWEGILTSFCYVINGVDNIELMTLAYLCSELILFARALNSADKLY